MNAITKNIPNSITCLNLLSGCFACLFAYKGEYDIVALCIGLSALFDFLDGMAARLLHAYSPMGKELDSLADLYTERSFSRITSRYSLLKIVGDDIRIKKKLEH